MARHGENIHKRKDGRWEGRYIKGRNKQNKPLWGYVYAPTYQQAREKLLRCRAECAYFALDTDDPTFEELARLWLESLSQGVRESTLYHYQYTLERYIFPILGQTRIKRLDERVLEQGLMQAISPQDGSHKPLGRSSAQECVALVRRVCKYACHLRLMRPVEIELTLPPAAPSRTTPLSGPEQQRAAAWVLKAPTARKVGLLLALQTGLRIGEVCGLQWGDFDLEQGFLTVRRTVRRICCCNGHSRVVVQRPKTRSSERVLPLPQGLVPVLRRLRGTLGGEVWFLSGTEERPVEPRCYRKSLHSYLRAARLRQVHPHALRHTFASTCLQAGCDIKTLSELMGHADAGITLKRYVHTSTERMRAEIDRIFCRPADVHLRC